MTLADPPYYGIFHNFFKIIFNPSLRKSSDKQPCQAKTISECSNSIIRWNSIKVWKFKNVEISVFLITHRKVVNTQRQYGLHQTGEFIKK